MVRTTVNSFHNSLVGAHFDVTRERIPGSGLEADPLTLPAWHNLKGIISNVRILEDLTCDLYHWILTLIQKPAKGFYKDLLAFLSR